MFFQYPAVHKVSTDPGPYGDALNHCVKYNYYRTPGDQITSVHECTHGINSQIRQGRTNGFYCLEDRGIHLEEPQGKKSDCIKFIPPDMRYGRYGLYVQGQKDWEGSPLYIFDEWIAYLNGARCMLYYADRGSHEGKNTDFLFGPVEFCTYGIATLLAHPRQDIEDFVRWMCCETEMLYLKGKDAFSWSDMDKCYAQLKSRDAFSKFFLNPDVNWVM